MNHFPASAAWFLVTGLAAQAPSLNQTRFDLLQAQLTPAEDVTWRLVPWRIELLAAQREAAAQNKPMFIWAMDGHPLGCT